MEETDPSDDESDLIDDWDLEGDVMVVMSASSLPDDAEASITECLSDLGPLYSDGWLVVWWMPVALDVDGLTLLGNTMPASEGWNCVFVSDRDNLLDLVIDTADQSRCCTVIDIAECF